MIVFKAIILLSIAISYDFHIQSKLMQELLNLQTGNEIPVEVPHQRVPYPTDLEPIILNEFKKCEESIKAPDQTEHKFDNMVIISRYSVPNLSNPWIVAINEHGKHSCTGSILNEKWVITAAHCFEDSNTRNYTILTGTSVFKDDGNHYNISKIIRHPRFDSCNHKNSDIALLKIDGTIHLNDTIKAIDLPSTPFEESVEGNQIMTTGWGKETNSVNETQHYLGEEWLTTIKSELCARAYKKLGKNGYVIFRSQFCTWNLNQNVCQGNSGGPAVMYKKGKPILVGTVSYGVRCLDKFPVVFSEISFFLNWINRTMSSN